MTYFLVWLASIVAAVIAWDHFVLGIVWYDWRELDSWKHWGRQDDNATVWTFRLGPLEVYRY